jgi:hypothetical protein
MTKDLEQIISRTVPAMQGWCTVEKALAMAQLIIESNAAMVIELGVFGGRSLIPQAMALRELSLGMIYGIDPWTKDACLEGTNDPANDEWWAKLDLEEIHRGCMRAIRENALDQWCSVIRAKGENVHTLFPPASIDILHIDGNHSEVASVRDVELWLPKVRVGGHVWLDDTDWATTKRAATLLTDACDVVKDVGPCRLFRKR